MLQGCWLLLPLHLVFSSDSVSFVCRLWLCLDPFLFHLLSPSSADSFLYGGVLKHPAVIRSIGDGAGSNPLCFVPPQTEKLQSVRARLCCFGSCPAVQVLPSETSGPEFQCSAVWRSEADLCFPGGSSLQTGTAQVWTLLGSSSGAWTGNSYRFLYLNICIQCHTVRALIHFSTSDTKTDSTEPRINGINKLKTFLQKHYRFISNSYHALH